MQEDFEDFSVTKQEFFCLQKVRKKYSFEYDGYTVYLTKATSGKFSMLLKYKYC